MTVVASMAFVSILVSLLVAVFLSCLMTMFSVVRGVVFLTPVVGRVPAMSGMPAVMSAAVTTAVPASLGEQQAAHQCDSQSHDRDQQFAIDPLHDPVPLCDLARANEARPMHGECGTAPAARRQIKKFSSDRPEPIDRHGGRPQREARVCRRESR